MARRIAWWVLRWGKLERAERHLYWGGFPTAIGTGLQRWGCHTEISSVRGLLGTRHVRPCTTHVRYVRRLANRCPSPLSFRRVEWAGSIQTTDTTSKSATIVRPSRTCRYIRKTLARCLTLQRGAERYPGPPQDVRFGDLPGPDRSGMGRAWSILTAESMACPGFRGVRTITSVNSAVATFARSVGRLTESHGLATVATPEMRRFIFPAFLRCGQVASRCESVPRACAAWLPSPRHRATLSASRQKPDRRYHSESRAFLSRSVRGTWRP